MDVERGLLERYPFAAVGGGEPVLVLAGAAPMTGVEGNGTVRGVLGPLMFDLPRCAPIRARTLILAGRDDRFYSPELFHETARLIPRSELHVLDGRGHITAMSDSRFRSALTGFLE